MARPTSVAIVVTSLIQQTTTTESTISCDNTTLASVMAQKDTRVLTNSADTLSISMQ
jgi:hypothetical protein